MKLATKYLPQIAYALMVLSFIGICQAHAWEFSRNPDRFPSVGLNANTARLDGERNNVNLPGTGLQQPFKDSGSLDFDAIGADVRLPINDGITLNFTYDRLTYGSNLVRDGNVYQQKDHFSGNRFGFGIRVYLNK